MASYAVILGNPTAGTPEGPQAIVVADENRLVVAGDTSLAVGLRAKLEGFDELAETETETLREFLTGLSMWTIDGPHVFEGDARSSADALAKVYGLPQ